MIHHHSRTGLQGTFSLKCFIVVGLLDSQPGFASFTDTAVRHPDAQRIADLVETTLTPSGNWLLAEETEISVVISEGGRRSAALQSLPGSHGRPPSALDTPAKLADPSDIPALLADIDWASGAEVLAEYLPVAQNREPSSPGMA